MQQRPQNLDRMGEDPEATLVTPRFDEEEARRAHPVVPLTGTRGRAPYSNVHARPRRGPRRSWPTALFAVVLLAAVSAGAVVATKVMRRPQASAPAQAEAAPVQTDGVPAQTEAAPAEAAPAPTQTTEAAWGDEAPSAPQASREEARAKRASRAPRGSRESGAGLAAAPAEIMRGAVEDSDDRDDRRRGREKRREREDDDDEAEKEIRKALKHAKGKAPRLVDVLTGP